MIITAASAKKQAILQTYLQEKVLFQEKIIAEIKQIPDEKLAEIYDLVHYFRLGLLQERQSLPVKQRPIGLAEGLLEIPPSFFEPLPDDILDAFESNQ